MKIKPTQDLILIKLLETEEKTKSGIYIPDTTKKEKTRKGKVIAIGEDVSKNIKVGNDIIFSFIEIKTILKKENFLLIKEEDILATFDNITKT